MVSYYPFCLQVTKAAVETGSLIFDLPIEIDNNAGNHESIAIVQVSGVALGGQNRRSKRALTIQST